MKRWLLGVTLVVTAALASGSDGGAADEPFALAQQGRRAGCRQPISALPGITRSWVVEREAGTAYVAWCARQTRQELVYDLVVATASPAHPWASCPSHIRLGLPRPLPDLRVSMLPRDLPYPMMLSHFWYFREDEEGDDESRIASTDIPQGPAIDYGAGGAGQLLLCRENRWIMGGYH